MPQVIKEVNNLIKNRKRYKTPLRFLNSTLFSSVVSFALGFVTFRYIAPEHLGIWGTFSTFTVYATFLRLGIPNGMNRELPYYYGKGDNETAMKCASTTLSYALFTTVVSLIVAICFFINFDFDKYGELSKDYFHTAIVFWIVVLIEPYTTYLSGTYRTSNHFDKLSQLQILKSILSAVTILLLVFWGFEGYLIRQLLISVFDPIYLHIYRPIKKIAIEFDFSIFKKLFVVGFQLFITSYASTFIDTLPRLFVIQNGSSLDVGLFSPVIILVSTVLLVPNVISQYLYPTFSYALGKGYDRIYFWNKLKPILLISLVIGVVAVGGAELLVDPVLSYFPKYGAAGIYIKASCIGFIFLGYKVCTLLCSIFKEWKWLYINTICYGVFMIGSIFVLQFLIEDPILVSSLSISLTTLLMFFISVYMAYRLTHKSV
ncbi:MAG: lipopolysaccharide biosynthesis protein [Bacteroidales bacterium]|nr:lipopolysaccharide biosynthesis protein [Bacteroidales bacterium]